MSRLGIGITAYGVLSCGLISGHWSAERTTAANDFRTYSPRFRPENLAHNLALVDALRAIADAKGVTVAQIAIAWVLSRRSDDCASGRRARRARLDEALGACAVVLTGDDLAQIEQAVPPDAAAGTRYAAPLMAHLDSEKGSHAPT